MSRLHVHISVDDIDANIRFYSTLFGRAPGVTKPDYAKWDLDDPAVNFAISTRGATTGLDHAGIQADSEAELSAIQSRMQQAGFAGTEQRDTACCYARSNKYWTQDPQGIVWESFHSLDSIPTFNHGDEAAATDSCCVPASVTTGCCQS